MSASLASAWAVLLVALPLALALAACVVGRRTTPVLVWAAPAVMAALAAGLVLGVVRHGALRYALGAWSPPLGIAWRIDGLSVTMLAMTAVVVGGVCLYAPAYFAARDRAGESRKAERFWPLIYVLWASLNALFLSADVFNLYVTLELLTLASVGLIVLAGTTDALTAALRYLVLGLMASLLYLMGVALLYASCGTLDLAALGDELHGDFLVGTAASLMIVGLLIKTALFPMHFWLPPAHAAAPAPVSALLSALVVKASFYLTLRLWFVLLPSAAQPSAAQLLGVLGTGAILWGAIQAWRAERLKMLVAYSTVAQLGYLFLVFPLASGTTAARTAWLGAILFALSHALAKSAMFLAAGSIRQLAGDDRLDRLAGIGQRAPLALSATALAGVSLMGLPPSGGFAGKWMLLVAGIESRQWWWCVVLVTGGLLTAAYLFRFWRIAIAAPDGIMDPTPANWRMDLPAFALGACAVLIVFLTTPLAGLLEAGAPFSAQGLTEAAR